MLSSLQSKSVDRPSPIRSYNIQGLPRRDETFEAPRRTRKNRSHSPSDSVKLPIIKKPGSEERDILNVQLTGHQYKMIPGNPLTKNSYPNLTLMTKLLTDEVQKKSLQQIMQKNPILAASLNVYASSHQQMIKHKKNRRQRDNGQGPKRVQVKQEVKEEVQNIQTKQYKQQTQPKQEQQQTQPQQGQSLVKQSLLRINKPKVFVNFDDQLPPQKFNYYLGKGNNEDIVRRVLSTRPHWVEGRLNTQMTIHFRWQQNYYGYTFDKMGSDGKKEIYNHFEYHKEITTKTGLVKNLQRWCGVNKSDAFSLTPTVFTLNLEDKSYQNDLNEFVAYYLDNMPESFKKQGNQNQQFLVLDLPSDNLKYVSPYRFSYEGTQAYNIGSNKATSTISPLTDQFLSSINYLWLLKPADMNRGNGVHVFNSLEELEQLLKSYYAGWVQKDFESPCKAKPTPNESQQINLIDSLEQNQLEKEENQPSQKEHFQQFDETKQCDLKNETVIQETQQDVQELNAMITVDSTPSQEAVPKTVQTNDETNINQSAKRGTYMRCRQFVIQKYLEKPFLIENRKFDIRIWVLMTHQMTYYVFKEGYIRTSSEQFSLSDENPFIHLTNNAVQKYSKNYSQFEGGNQISFDSFQHFLDSQQGSSYHFKRKVYPRIKEIIKISLCSVKQKLNKYNRKNCFEIFGYDFILDSNLRPWLIEVNTNPCIEESSDLLRVYIPRMLNDAFKLTIDTIITPSEDFDENKQEYPVKNYLDTENMWEFLGQY